MLVLNDSIPTKIPNDASLHGVARELDELSANVSVRLRSLLDRCRGQGLVGGAEGSYAAGGDRRLSLLRAVEPRGCAEAFGGSSRSWSAR